MCIWFQCICKPAAAPLRKWRQFWPSITSPHPPCPPTWSHQRHGGWQVTTILTRSHCNLFFTSTLHRRPWEKWFFPQGPYINLREEREGRKGKRFERWVGICWSVHPGVMYIWFYSSQALDGEIKGSPLPCNIFIFHTLRRQCNIYGSLDQRLKHNYYIKITINYTRNKRKISYELIYCYLFWH